VNAAAATAVAYWKE